MIATNSSKQATQQAPLPIQSRLLGLFCGETCLISKKKKLYLVNGQGAVGDDELLLVLLVLLHLGEGGFTES